MKAISMDKKYSDDVGEIKILCFVEKNYLVAKRKRCSPFVISLNAFAKRFKEVIK